MEKTQSFTYTSPDTGVEYLVVPRLRTRMSGDWYKGEELKPVEYTEYVIVLNGNPVQFALSLDGVSGSVKHFENPGPDISSRFD